MNKVTAPRLRGQRRRAGINTPLTPRRRNRRPDREATEEAIMATIRDFSARTIDVRDPLFDTSFLSLPCMKGGVR